MARKSIKYQVERMLSSKVAYGESRQEDKLSGGSENKIYSFNTYKTYVRECTHFGEWAKEKYGCMRMDQAEVHAPEYIKMLNESARSAYSVKTVRSALAKLYGTTGEKYGDTKNRSRADIKNSRQTVKYDKHFNEKNHKDIVNFCNNTGLRRHEIQKFKPEHVSKDYSHITVKGKGGKIRQAYVLPAYRKELQELCDRTRSDARPFYKIPHAMNTHSYRSNYATAYYNSIKRDINSIAYNERYYCRNELSGIVYDRKAMLIVSKSLGHERINVIAGHYLRI